MENDYVWIDASGDIWRVCMKGKTETLHYWNDFSMAWVPLRPTRYPDDAWMMQQPGLPEEQAELYNLLSKMHGGPG